MKVLGLAAAAAAFLLAVPAQAADTYVCKLKGHGPGNWIPTDVFIGHDTKSGKVVVSDPVILHYNKGQPMAGEVAISNSKRITFAWKVFGKSKSGQVAPNLFYRATYLRGSGQMQIQMTPAGYANRFQGSGKCALKSS